MRTRVLALPLALVASLGLSILPATGVAGSTATVKLKDDFFSPTSKTVRKNTTVVFRWAGRAPHDVKVTKGPVKFSSKIQTKGTYKKKLTRKGTYTIVCTIHPGMEMKLKVK